MKKMRFPSLVRPSTRAWWQEVRQTENYSWFDTLHGYIYGRFPYFYISVGTGRHKLARWIAPLAAFIIQIFSRHASTSPAAGAPASVSAMGQEFANGYHGKVVPLEAARQLVSVKQEIRITNLEKIIPYSRARDIILHNPDHIIALDCPCRLSRENPCLPLDVCLIVGEPFASFVAEHQPGHTRWITSEQAQQILQQENERGHVAHAFFKDAMLGRFYAICNCCDCCCGAMQAQRSGTPMLAASGYRAEIDQDACIACGNCASYCSFHAIQTGDSTHIDAQACMGCGVCVHHCPQEAIQLVRDTSKGDPLEIERLMEAALAQ